MGALLVFLVGASGYGTIEILWRGYTHWSMLIAGGVCLLLLYKVFSYLKSSTIITKCLLGGLIITTIELIAGALVNLELGMDVWDYSKIPFNLYGQVCLLYSFLWVLLCVPVVYLCRRLKSFIDKYSG